MDYEKRYKEALKWMQSLYGGLHGATKEEAEKYFPELKESEDERIRKAIKKALQVRCDGSRIISDEPVTLEEATAWLEKQGEKSTNIDIDKMVMEYSQTKDGDFGLPVNCMIRAYRKGINDALSIALNIEEQGEKKKSEDNKSKFEVGDWIVINETTYQITEIDNSHVALSFNGRECNFGLDVFNNARLWTIQDAKDGDLIYVSTGIKGFQAIFHKFENGIIYFHCNLCSDFTQGGYEPSGNVEFVSPLQKIHYQKFFQKMKEAGYEWDSDKKELKKIEQKKLDADKVIEWLNNQACLGWIEDVEVDKFVDKFKKDFGL